MKSVGTILYLLVHFIGASLSEPHIDEFAVEFVYNNYIYRYIYIVRRVGMRISGKGVSACRAPAGMKFITSWYEDGARSMDEREMSSGLEELEQLHASGAVRHLYPPAPHIADDKKLGRAWKPPRVRAMAACSQGLLATSGAEQ